MSKLAVILPVVYFAVDLLVLTFTFLASINFFDQYNFQGVEWVMLVAFSSIWVIIGYITMLYSRNLHNGFFSRMINYGSSYLIFAAIIGLFYLFSKFPPAVENAVLAFAVSFVVLNALVNSILINTIIWFRRNRRNTINTLVAGVGDLAARTAKYFNSNPDYGYTIRGYLKCNGEVCKVNEKKVVGTIYDMKEFLNQNTIDEIVIALPYELSQSKIKDIIHQADFHGVRVSYVPDYEGLFGNHFKIVHDGELEAVNIHNMPQDEIYATLEKGLFDLAFSSVALLLLSPVFLFIATLIKIDSPGPILYCPVRVGRGGKNFTVYKFRTMCENDAVLGGTLSTKKDDPRVTKVGRILRKYNLDELPQFLNVFLGDMSVVGPRPHRHFLNQQMKEHVDKYMIRHYFRPGITGWAQVNGWRGPTETEEQISQRTAHDLWYIENWSFMLDVKIIWMTIFSRKARQNAF